MRTRSLQDFCSTGWVITFRPVAYLMQRLPSGEGGGSVGRCMWSFGTLCRIPRLWGNRGGDEGAYSAYGGAGGLISVVSGRPNQRGSKIPLLKIMQSHVALAQRFRRFSNQKKTNRLPKRHC